MKFYPGTEATHPSWLFLDVLGVIHNKDGNTLIVYDPKTEPPQDESEFPSRRMTQKDKQKLIQFLFTLPIVDERGTP